MKALVLGTGCAKCQQLAERVDEAAKSAGLPVEVVKVTEIQEILALGVMSTPALVLDGTVVLSGKVPAVAELQELLRRHSK